MLVYLLSLRHLHPDVYKESITVANSIDVKVTTLPMITIDNSDSPSKGRRPRQPLSCVERNNYQQPTPPLRRALAVASAPLLKLPSLSFHSYRHERSHSCAGRSDAATCR